MGVGVDILLYLEGTALLLELHSYCYVEGLICLGEAIVVSVLHVATCIGSVALDIDEVLDEARV